jgi:NAD+ kinase
MKVAVVGLDRHLVEQKLPKYNLKLDKKDPDIVISFGGDGSALYAERVYPGIPRIMIKHSKVCKKCGQHDFSKIFSLLKQDKYEIEEEIKVQGILNKNPKIFIGLNEIGIYHKIPTKAVRLKVKLDGKVIEDNVIGDGILVATPYGSTAYFHSITRKSFKKGLGIAFNNSVKKRKHRIVNENSIIEVEILRGKAWMAADNNELMFPIGKDDKVTIKKSDQKAKIIKIKGKDRIQI